MLYYSCTTPCNSLFVRQGTRAMETRIRTTARNKPKQELTMQFTCPGMFIGKYKGIVVTRYLVDEKAFILRNRRSINMSVDGFLLPLPPVGPFVIYVVTKKLTASTFLRTTHPCQVSVRPSVTNRNKMHALPFEFPMFWQVLQFHTACLCTAYLNSKHAIRQKHRLPTNKYSHTMADGLV